MSRSQYYVTHRNHVCPGGAAAAAAAAVGLSAEADLAGDGGEWDATEDLDADAAALHLSAEAAAPVDHDPHALAHTSSERR